MAQGVLKSATSLIANGGSPLDSDWALPSDWQAAHSAATIAACKIFRLNQSLLH
jgi:hypothetical protein